MTDFAAQFLVAIMTVVTAILNFSPPPKTTYPIVSVHSDPDTGEVITTVQEAPSEVAGPWRCETPDGRQMVYGGTPQSFGDDVNCWLEE
jgi:hypothetical protein